MTKEVRYLKSFYWKDYLVITVGLMLFSIGFTGFIMPNEIVVGGLGGVGLLLKYAFGLPVFMTFRWERPHDGGGLVHTGQRVCLQSTLWSGGVTLLMAVAENLIAGDHPYRPADCRIIGAVFSGTGLGLIYTRNASTGERTSLAYHHQVSLHQHGTRFALHRPGHRGQLLSAVSEL